MSKHPKLVSISGKPKKREMNTLASAQKQAQKDARQLVAMCGGLNKAAKAIEMSKGRLSFIVRGSWRNVAITEIDLVMLRTGVNILQTDLALTTEAREIAAEFQTQLASLAVTGRKLDKALRRL